ALVAFGQDDRGLPVVLEVAAKARGLRGKAGEVLPWLPWAKREETYKRLVALELDAEQTGDIVRGLTSRRDKRTLPLLWDLAGRPGLTTDLLDLAAEKLLAAYFGNDLYTRVNGVRPIKADDRKQAAAE